MTQRVPCIDVIGLARCTGCFGCQSACHVDAIKLLLDADGFYKPLVDRNKCNECGLCQLSCPVILAQIGKLDADRFREPKAFAAWSKDEKVRLSSSSGGVFSELARQTLSAGGVVVGCVWGNGWTPEHILARTWSDVERMRGSKYVPSKVGDVYRQVKDFLAMNDNPVLFSGTPCQVAALEALLRPEQRERVLLVEFICHGVPSLRVFHLYMHELFGGESVVSYTFRDKTLGVPTVLATAAFRAQHLIPMSSDSFFQGFVCHHLYVMEVCSTCPFACMPRRGDITLGDFWGCPEQWQDKRGVSVVFASTEKGMEALQLTSKLGHVELRITEVAVATLRNSRAVRSRGYSIPRARRAFLDGMIKGASFKRLRGKYFPRRLHLFWYSFLSSQSKWRFIVSFIVRRIRRIQKMKE